MMNWLSTYLDHACDSFRMQVLFRMSKRIDSDFIDTEESDRLRRIRQCAQEKLLRMVE